MRAKSPAPRRRQLSRVTSAPIGKSATLTPSPLSGNRKANQKPLSRKSSASSRMSDSQTSLDSQDSAQFANFVKTNLQDSGIICSKEDEEVIEDAIEKTLLEIGEEGSNSPMLQIVDGSADQEELEQRNPEKFQKLRELATFNYENISLDDINMAAEEVEEENDDGNRSKPVIEGDFIEESNQSGSGVSYLSIREEDTRDSTDTFYSLKEESEEEKLSDFNEESEEEIDSKKSEKSKSSDSISFEKAFKKLQCQKIQ